MRVNGFDCDIMDGHFPDYDVKVSGHGLEFTAEVKFDKYSKKSGNLAFEYYNSKLNKPSGIMATKSDLWVQILDEDNILVGDTRKIRNLPISSAYRPVRVVEGAGDGNADIILYKAETLIDSLLFRLNHQTDVIIFLKGILNGKV